MEYSNFLVIIYTIVGLAFMAIIGYFYHTHEQNKEAIKANTIASAKDNVGRLFPGGRKKRKLKK